MSEPARVSEAQLRYLSGLTAPDRLAALSSAEARLLIAWLRGAPPNMTRAQHCLLWGLVERLDRQQARQLIDELRQRTAEPGKL